MGASRDGGVAARRRGAPRGTGGRGEALATSKGRRGGAGTLRRRLGRGVLLLARGRRHRAPGEPESNFNYRSLTKTISTGHAVLAVGVVPPPALPPRAYGIRHISPMRM